MKMDLARMALITSLAAPFSLAVGVPLAARAAPPIASAFNPPGGLPEFWTKRVGMARAMRGHTDMVIKPGVVEEMRRNSIRSYFPEGNEIAICNRELGALRQKHQEFLAARERRLQSRRTFTQVDLDRQLERLRKARIWVIGETAKPKSELGKRLRKYEKAIEGLSPTDFEGDMNNLGVTTRRVNEAKRQADEISGVFKRAMDNPEGPELDFKAEGQPPRFEMISACTVRDGNRYCSTTSYQREGAETGTDVGAMRAAVWGNLDKDPALTVEQYFDEQARTQGLLTACMNYDVLYGAQPTPARQSASDRKRAPEKSTVPEVPLPAPGEVRDAEGAR